MNRILIVLAALMSMGSAANATTLATGALYGGVTQNTAFCYFYNAGQSTVSISGKQIIREFVGPVPFFIDNCGTLNAGTICRFAANIVKDSVHACKAVVDPDGSQVRGILDIRAGGTVLKTEQLR